MESSSNKSKTKRHRSSLSVQFGVFLIVIAVIIVILVFLLRGRETVSGEFPNPVTNEALTCKKNNAAYTKISTLSSKSQEIAITMIFNGTTSLNKISLDYTLKFDTATVSDSIKASAQEQFSNYLSIDKFSFTEFNNKFSLIKDKLLVSVYGDAADLESSARASYFMLDTKKSVPKTLEDFRKAYEKQSFECTSTTDK
ncbi:hypothetical protein IKG31_04070 [Candidatus Saccharibacteria bacterium]|nr:hypothetical protein [Candidatus Saccharibacteria bacterium]